MISTLRRTKLGSKLGGPIGLPLRIPVIDGDVLSFYVARAREVPGESPRHGQTHELDLATIDTLSEVTFVRLLRQRRRAKRKEHDDAKRQCRKQFPSTLRSLLLLLSLLTATLLQLLI